MGAVGDFSVCVEREGQGPVVRLSGELDFATTPMLEECLHGLDGEAVTVDFSDVTFLDSSGLRVLMMRHTETGAGKLVLRGVQRAQMTVFQVTGLDEVLNFDGG